MSSTLMHDQSAEIGNVKNHLQSTSRSLKAAKQERGTLEQNLAGQASQLSTLQTQLSSAKAAYETETSLLATLRDRHSTQLSEMQRTREELIRAESDLSAIRVEKSEIEGAFLRDKEEARDLHKRMVETGQQAEALKADVEKLKKEAKQQKGLLAIARKQLSTKESEKVRAEKEHEIALADVASIAQEKEQVDGEIANLDALFPAQKAVASPSPSGSLMLAAAQPLPTTPTPDLVSQGAKSNNPFERLALASGTSTPRSQSPFLGLSSTLVSSPPLSTHESLVPANQPDASPQEGIKSPVADRDTEIFYLSKETTSSGALEGVVSPETANGTDYFVTPPTSARRNSSPPPNPAERFPSLEDLSPPPLHSAEKPTNPVPVNLTPVHKTDLNAQLKEIEIEESDSDEEADENLIMGQTTNGKVPLASPIPLPQSIPDATQVTAPVDSFDDVFGSDEPHDKPLGNGDSNAFDLSIPPTDFIGAEPVVGQTPVAGVNEFDEALGKLPGSTAAPPAIFSFDTTFDDNFDFASASNAVDFLSASANEQKEKSPGGISGMPTTLSEPPAQPSFTNQLTMPVPTNDVPKFESSFEGTFSGSDPVITTKSEDKPLPSAAVPVQPKDDRSLSGFPSSPIQGSPKVGTTSSRVVEARPVSPPRAVSPSPRVVSPKPRISSSSSKEIHEKVKESSVRHSKLSVSCPHFALSCRLNLSIDSPSIRQEEETPGTDASTALTTSYSSSRTTLSYHHSC